MSLQYQTGHGDLYKDMKTRSKICLWHAVRFIMRTGLLVEEGVFMFGCDEE